ncbi:MAG: hypothetical protein K6C07_07555 [Bacteroidales bacterium]|nr:hypothetical protein [Bacteroidales bacterium]
MDKKTPFSDGMKIRFWRKNPHDAGSRKRSKKVWQYPDCEKGAQICAPAFYYVDTLRLDLFHHHLTYRVAVGGLNAQKLFFVHTIKNTILRFS